MSKSRQLFGSDTRAREGCIVTFELPDGEILVERFTQLVHTTGGYARIVNITGPPYIEQAAERADELGAKIVTISTPQTILTDLEGTRAQLNPRAAGKHGLKGGTVLAPPDVTPYPEATMLGRIKRLDLFKRPSNGKAEQNIRHYRQARPSGRGGLSQ